MRLVIAALLAASLLAGCTSSSTVKTSADTMIVSTRAAPVCGDVGAERVAQQQAAVETIKAGYDRYIIYDAASASNVQVHQMPGSYSTSGTVYNGSINATTTYQPGPTFVSGGHKQAFAIKMFRESDPNAAMALSARQTLGPDWEKKVKAGSLGVCF